MSYLSEYIKGQVRFVKLLLDLLVWCYENGYQVRLGDAYRSTDKLSVPGIEEKYSYQDLLVYNKKSKVKNSKHNDRMAIDLIIHHSDGRLLNDEEYRPIGEKWESLGGVWGGRFGVKKEEYNTKVGWDVGHFEL